MNIEDFRYMRRGKHIKPLTKEDMKLLLPIDIKHEGNDRALLLLHGFSSSPAVFRDLLPQLTYYNAIKAPVLPGHAESIAAFSTATAQQWIKTSEEQCAALLNEYKKVDVLGLSLGGLLACHLSQQFTLNHLYLLAPALFLRHGLFFKIQLARCLKGVGFKCVRNRAGNLHTDRRAEITYRQLPLDTILEILRLIKNFTWQASTCPTDIFIGRYDQVVDSVKIAKAFEKTPQVTIHWLEQSAHILTLDGDVGSLIQWITGHSQSESRF